VTVPETTLARVREAAARIASSYGLEIFDVQFRREAPGWVLRVILDRPASGAGGADDGVGIADCQRVSQDLSAKLDVEEDLLEGLSRAYTLEVSSPGLDRALRGEADYQRFAGRLAKIVTTEPVAKQSHFAGRIAGVVDGAVELREGARTHRIPLDRIRRAKLDVEF
jgi:ribosome maturation factor RimP